MENLRNSIISIMRKDYKDGGLGWTREKASKWENNIFNSCDPKDYENKAYSFIENCLQVKKLENQGIQF